ncbi:MAG TPA: hypothetical protein VE967_03880 [Gemmatimonadaceae bacterium]|nr:hypothetical protein [Gemmatimonadaceae bacterium]
MTAGAKGKRATGLEGPPRSAEVFAAAIIPDANLREVVLGDLAEEHARIAHASRLRANAWYWWQLIRSALPLTFSAVARGGWRAWTRLAVAVIVAYAALFVLVMVSDAMLWRFFSASWLQGTMLVASVLTGVLCAVVAGYAAACICSRAPVAPGFVLGLLCIAMGVMLVSRGGDGLPIWYWVSLESIVLPSSIVGAALRARQLIGRTS